MKNIVCLIVLLVSYTCWGFPIGEFPSLNIWNEPPNDKRPSPISAPTNTVWNAYSLWDQVWNTEPEGEDLATFDLPHSEQNGTYVSFLTTTLNTNDIGDLSGKSIQAIFEITVTGGAPVDFVYGYEGTRRNTCPAPANIRLYFTSTKSDYQLSHANNQKQQVDYWWCDVEQTDLDATFAFDQLTYLEANLDNPAMWSDSQGVSGSQRPVAFRNAVKHIQQIGLSFGGACFYDTGVGVRLADNGMGNPICTFHLKAYFVYLNHNPKRGN